MSITSTTSTAFTNNGAAAGANTGTGIMLPDWLFLARPDLISQDQAAVRFTCPVCGVVEPVRFANGYSRRECKCERARRERAALAQMQADAHAFLAKRRAARTYTWLGTHGAYDDLAARTFERFERRLQPVAYDFATTWVAAPGGKSGGKSDGNILFTGSYGTGKTHLACAILNRLREAGTSCLFCKVPDFFRALYAASFDEKDALMAEIAQADVVVLDDLDKLYVKRASVSRGDGAGGGGGGGDGGIDLAAQERSYQQSILYDIIDRRYVARRPIIITTNEGKDLSKWLDGASVSRLHEHMHMVEMKGIDYRIAAHAKSASGARG